MADCKIGLFTQFQRTQIFVINSSKSSITKTNYFCSNDVNSATEKKQWRSGKNKFKIITEAKIMPDYKHTEINCNYVNGIKRILQTHFHEEAHTHDICPILSIAAPTCIDPSCHHLSALYNV